MSVDNPVPCNLCQQKIFFIRTKDVYTSGPKKGKPIYTVMSYETRLKHDCPKKNQKRMTELGDNSLSTTQKKPDIKKKDYNLFQPSGRFCPVCNIELDYAMAHCHGKREMCNHCKVEIDTCKGHGQFTTYESGHKDFINVSYPEQKNVEVTMFERGWCHTCKNGETRTIDVTNITICPHCSKSFI